MKKVLTIAGSDSCGGAGIQADLKTFASLRVYGISVVTAVTAQNTTGVYAVEEVSPAVVTAQIDCLFEDIPVDAVKIGMVSSTGIIQAIAQGLEKWDAQNVVLDPVMVSKSGSDLLRPDARDALVNRLLPLATVVTPNIPEAQALAGRKITTVSDMEAAAKAIRDMGPCHVVIKGGHLEGEPVDVFYDGQQFTPLPARRVATKNNHGTGCTFSSAIAACLALGHSPLEAVRLAKEYITQAIAHSFSIGHGVGPTHHFFRYYEA
ncbi:phosphomethylpyrimidine kinase [Clostridiales bacterium PH28_bin88]|nr:phosphomethylpyrimidine kinase [Clostridiales bacterium PH28_bin88]